LAERSFANKMINLVIEPKRSIYIQNISASAQSGALAAFQNFFKLMLAKLIYKKNNILTMEKCK
jgi:hypothetical protein